MNSVARGLRLQNLGSHTQYIERLTNKYSNLGCISVNLKQRIVNNDCGMLDIDMTSRYYQSKQNYKDFITLKSIKELNHNLVGYIWKIEYHSIYYFYHRLLFFYDLINYSDVNKDLELQQKVNDIVNVWETHTAPNLSRVEHRFSIRKNDPMFTNKLHIEISDIVTQDPYLRDKLGTKCKLIARGLIK